MPTQYLWKRFLCLRTDTYSLDLNGFLIDPDNKNEYVKHPQPSLKTVAQIEDLACVVFLGEPGIGKSNVLHDAVNDRQTPNGSSISLYRNLNMYISDGFLVRDIFESKEVELWKSDAKKNLYLYLDSLDECLLNLATVCQILAEQLSRLPVNRLFLRLSCRTGVWPQYLENSLKSIFSIEDLPVFEVTPLREIDVEMACKTEGIDTENFLDAVVDRNVVAFAIKPVTLRFLFKIYRSSQSLPDDQQTLYLNGCYQLCEEMNPSRKAKLGSIGASTEVKFKIACRIAALSILTNKNTIWLGNEHDKGTGDITIADIVGGSNNKEDEILTTDSIVRETLDTGLFTSRGPDRMGWSHQTYAEFLTAVHLSKSSLDLSQLKTLFFNPNPADPKLIPQLQQAAAFLSSRRSDFFDLLLERDPEIILRNDNSNLSNECKERAIERMFEQIEIGESFGRFDDGLLKRFNGLRHPQLEDQVCRILINKSSNLQLRHLAVDVARVCNLKRLSENVLSVALDRTEEYYLRVNAAQSAICLLDDGREIEFKKLLSEEESDPEDELKGYALSALWPAHISINDLFTQITPPKKEYFFGAYAFFLWEDLIDGISDNDFPIALAWAEQYVDQAPNHSRFGQTINRIVQSSWKKIESANLHVPFARVAYRKLVSHQPIIEKLESKEFASEFYASVADRRKIFLAIFDQFPPDKIEPYFIYGNSSNLLNSGDLLWLIEQVKSEGHPGKQKRFIEILHIYVDWSNASQVDEIFRLSQESEAAAEYFRWRIGPIELGSKDAIEMKRQHEQTKSWAKKDKEDVDWASKIFGHISQCLEELKKGHQGYFTNLVDCLCADLKNGQNRREIQIADAEIWKLLDIPTQQRVIASIKTYLNQFSPEIESYLKSNTIKFSTLAGTRSLMLLAEVDPQYLRTQGSVFWAKWAPPLLAYSVTGDDPNRTLLNIAYANAQESFEETVLQLATKEAKEHGTIYVTKKYRQFISPNLLNKFLNIARGLPPKPAISILGELVSFGIKPAENLLESYISAPLPVDSEAKSFVLLAASTLISEAPEAGWNMLFPLFQRDRQFGREVVLNGPSRRVVADTFLQRLTDKQLGEFYSWMTVEFPHERERGGGLVRPEDRAVSLKSAAIEQLVHRGTRSSCETIRNLVRVHPKQTFLTWHLTEAEKRNRWLDWTPPSPAHLLLMTSDSLKTLVRNEGDLVTAVLNSLRRFEGRLHGTTPAIADLWNTEKGRFHPKNENEISDRIKRHLEEDLRDKAIIVNREVEIRRSVGPGTGQRTDIQVDASVPQKNGGRDKLTVIVEVKGCWHSEVLDAVETQLANRYLRDNSTHCGIYLIADCLCERWNDDNDRKDQSRKNNMIDKYREIESRSRKLSEIGYSITSFLLNCKY